MSTDRQRLIESLFMEASELDAKARLEFLTTRCGNDAELRRELESLLGAHEDAGGGLLDEPQPLTQGLMKELSGLLRADDATIPPSGKIGAYSVHRVLGSGGMGVVYLAEQERPKRTVALKVIRRGLATASLLRRFEHEAEILGRLHHAGIAQIYEAGVARGGSDGPQPYIAMEYIDGRTLTEHARVYNLGVKEKLVLMARVCEAVQHAHQRGVIHRDLKPGNILVQAEEASTAGDGTGTTLGLGGSGVVGLGTNVGQPKILDFGVARLAEERPGGGRVTTMGTNVGQLIGTLAYMSPEQLGADARELDTRSDVYALGVVLFQLLTGKLPYEVQNRALPEAVRMIKEDPPTRLSSIDRELRGDLETIVAKAIEKEKGRRYQSAAELGADLHRFLLNEPIAAKRDSALYMLRKQMLRYKSAVGVAAVGVMALVAFAVYAAISAERFKAVAASERLALTTAQMEKDRADGAARRLQQELFVSNVERGRLEGVSGKVVVAEELLWGEYFRDPSLPHARWALWELYNHFPCRWTVQGTTWQQGRALTVTSDKKIAAFGGESRSVTILDAETGSDLGKIEQLPGSVVGLAFEPGTTRLLIGMANGGACIVDYTSAQNRIYLMDPTSAHTGAVRGVAWSPDGRWLATGGGDRKIRIWDAATVERVAEWEAHGDDVWSVDFSADSARLASGSQEAGPDARVRIWSVPDGRPLSELDARKSFITRVRFSPDGGLLAVASYERVVFIHDLKAGTVKYVPAKFSGPCHALAFSPDGRKLLGAGGGESRIWMMPDGNEAMALGQHREQIIGAEWLNATRVVTGSRDGALKGWDAKRANAMRAVGPFTSWCFGTAYSPDGSRLAIGSGDGSVVIANAQTHKRIHTMATGDNMRTRPVMFVPGEDRLLAGCADGTIRVFDTNSGTEVQRFGEPGREIFAISLHTDGKTLVSGHSDRVIRVWNRHTGEKEQELRDPRLVNRIEGVAFSPDGKMMVSGGPAKGVMLWSTSTWKPTAVLEGSAQAWPVSFSPDGKLIAAGTWGDTVELWEVETRLPVGALTGHRGLISTISFSPDGVYIASGGDDATVKLWHVNSRRCVLTLDTYHGEATGLSFHPSGTRVSTGCQDHMTTTWDLMALEPHLQGNLAYQKARETSRLPAAAAPEPKN